jgi:peptidoglycan/LPS O-acetylase OafA/YrhL
VSLGDASYGIYLVHFIVIDLVCWEMREAGVALGFWPSLPIIAGFAQAEAKRLLAKLEYSH